MCGTSLFDHVKYMYDVKIAVNDEFHPQQPMNIYQHGENWLTNNISTNRVVENSL